MHWIRLMDFACSNGFLTNELQNGSKHIQINPISSEYICYLYDLYNSEPHLKACVDLLTSSLTSGKIQLSIDSETLTMEPFEEHFILHQLLPLVPELVIQRTCLGFAVIQISGNPVTVSIPDFADISLEYVKTGKIGGRYERYMRAVDLKGNIIRNIYVFMDMFGFAPGQGAKLTSPLVSLQADITFAHRTRELRNYSDSLNLATPLLISNTAGPSAKTASRPIAFESTEERLDDHEQMQTELDVISVKSHADFIKLQKSNKNVSNSYITNTQNMLLSSNGTTRSVPSTLHHMRCNVINDARTLGYNRNVVKVGKTVTQQDVKEASDMMQQKIEILMGIPRSILRESTVRADPLTRRLYQNRVQRVASEISTLFSALYHLFYVECVIMQSNKKSEATDSSDESQATGASEESTATGASEESTATGAGEESKVTSVGDERGLCNTGKPPKVKQANKSPFYKQIEISVFMENSIISRTFKNIGNYIEILKRRLGFILTSITPIEDLKLLRDEDILDKETYKQCLLQTYGFQISR